MRRPGTDRPDGRTTARWRTAIRSSPCRRLLKRIGVVREAVEQLGAPAAHGREIVASEALRPAAASDLWQERLTFGGVRRTCRRGIQGHHRRSKPASAEEEALAIAIALREAMETPDKTAALVTPDRALARRVLAALARWNVPVDDSGGDALSDTPAGVFARLVAEAAHRRPAAGDLAGDAQARDMRARPPCGCGAGARGAARATAEAGQRGAGARACDLPRRACETAARRGVVAASVRSAHGAHGSRSLQPPAH